MFSIGLMQGRMLPPDRFTYQNFPENNWKEEIDLIDKMGFDFVECLYDEDNKISSMIEYFKKSKKVEDIDRKRLLRAICLDAITNLSIDDGHKIQNYLRDLENFIKILPLEMIILPFLSNDSLRDKEFAKKVIDIINSVNLESMNEGKELRFALELNLSSDLIIEAFSDLEIKNLGICLDLGNLMHLGLRPEKEIKKLNHLIYHVHIKDRKIGGPNVILGQGDVDFLECLNALKDIEYKGMMTLETSYPYNPIDCAKDNLLFVNSLFEVNK